MESNVSQEKARQRTKKKGSQSTLPPLPVPAPIYAAVLSLVQAIKSLPTLEAVILFGSAATGEMHKKSDVDLLLLFNTDHNPELGEEARYIHAHTGEIERTYKLENPFSFVFVNRGEHIDTDFLWEVARDGLMLYGRPETLLGRETYLTLTPVSIISYDLSGIPRKDRVFVERKLYGYHARPTYKEKEYAIEREGVVTQALHGKRLGRGAIMIDAQSADRVLKLFNERGIVYTLIKAWV